MRENRGVVGVLEEAQLYFGDRTRRNRNSPEPAVEFDGGRILNADLVRQSQMPIPCPRYPHKQNTDEPDRGSLL